MAQKTKAQPAVTVNITAHSEGYFLYRSIRSALACCSFANKEGIKTTINVHLDSADALTNEIAESFYKDAQVNIFRNTFGDLSSSRNFLIGKTKTPYILILDGDDLFSEDFIVKAVQTAEKHGKPCVVSAEKIFKFSHQIDQLVHIAESTVVKPGIKSALFETNLYVSQNLVSTEIFKHCTYEPNKNNYGFEDWHWNTKVIAAGFEYLVASNTAFFYRQKPDDKSLLKFSTNSNTVLRHTPLFDPSVFKTVPCQRYYPIPEEVVYRETRIDLLKSGFKRELKGSLAYRAMRMIYHKSLAAKTKASRLVEGRITRLKTPETVIDGMAVDIDRLKVTPREKIIWNKLNSIEPVIRFDSTNEDNFRTYKYTFEHSLVTAYHDFCTKYADRNFTDIIFVPWINKGGADLAMVDLAKKIAEAGGRVLVITTTGLDSQWGDKIREIPNTVLIESHDDIFRHLDHINMKLFFLRLVQNWAIKTMTVMNSSIGFELIERFGSAICDAGCKIIVHNYAFPTQDGLFIDAFPSLAMSFEKVDGIVVDSQIHKKEINDIYGYPLEKITEVPLVIDARIKEKTSNDVTRKILFANRIAREKQPDVAIATAQLLKSEGISLDVYGTVDEDYAATINFYEEIEKSENVEFKGLFESSLTLDFSQYDICFMPSLYEGTPRIVLEAAKAGLYVVCSEAGGMPEVVSSKFSGDVLPVTSTPSDYAKSIKKFYKSKELHDMKKRHESNKEMVKHHSEDYYDHSIRQVYGLKAGSR